MRARARTVPPLVSVGARDVSFRPESPRSWRSWIGRSKMCENCSWLSCGPVLLDLDYRLTRRLGGCASTTSTASVR